jgi:hypothetical protein
MSKVLVTVSPSYTRTFINKWLYSPLLGPGRFFQFRQTIRGARGSVIG